MKRFMQGLAAGFVTLALAACGGSGSTGGSALVTQATNGTMVKTSASTIAVNGRTFGVSRATVRINGAASTPAGLRSGMRVHVRSNTSGNGGNEASEVDSDAEVRGAVTAVSPATATQPASFDIGNVKVVVDANTVYDDLTPASFDAIKVGVVVEVDGTRNAAGDIVATRVEGKSASGQEDDELRGPVTAVAADRTSLTVGAQIVAVNATTTFDPPATCSLGSIKLGDLVEVHGSFGTGGSFTATRIECIPAREQGDGMDGEENEVEGMVANPDKTAKTFSVDTHAVRYTATTQFKNGTVDNLVVDARVEVKGTMDGPTLVATEIEFEAKP